MLMPKMVADMGLQRADTAWPTEKSGLSSEENAAARAIGPRCNGDLPELGRMCKT